MVGDDRPAPGGAHLIIVIVDEGQDAARLLSRLIVGLSLAGGWALRAKKEQTAEFVECVFENKAVADHVAKLFGATVIGHYASWKSQREFRLNKAAETMILRALEELSKKEKPRSVSAERGDCHVY